MYLNNHCEFFVIMKHFRVYNTGTERLSSRKVENQFFFLLQCAFIPFFSEHPYIHKTLFTSKKNTLKRKNGIFKLIRKYKYNKEAYRHFMEVLFDKENHFHTLDY